MNSAIFEEKKLLTFKNLNFIEMSVYCYSKYDEKSLKYSYLIQYAYVLEDNDGDNDDDN